MKFRFILTFLLLAVYHFISAQQPQVYQYFDFSELECGGKYITGRLAFYSADSTFSQRGFNEDNRFFLEIAAADSKEYRMLKEGRPDHGMAGRARFELPDTLVIGRKYKLRMSSDSPRLMTEEPSYFVYAPGLRPFSVKFGQEVSLEGENSAQLKVKVKVEDTLYETGYAAYPYHMVLSDGSRSFKYQSRATNDFSITVIPTDSVTVYRISEIVTGSCGLKGKVEGEALVTKKLYTERIYMRPVSGIAEICRDTPLGLVVDTRIPRDAAGYRVEFSLLNGSGTSYIIDNQVPGAGDVLWVNIPKELESNSYLYCRVVHKKTQKVSEWLYFSRASKIIEAKNYLNAAGIDSMKIDFFPSSNENFSYARITSITVNGQELRQGKELDGTSWGFPLPQRDTSFVITAINSTCGAVPFSPGTIDFKKDKTVSYTLTTPKTDFCEGEVVEIGYVLSDPTKLGSLRPLASLGVSGYGYDPVTGAPSNTWISIPSLELPVKIDTQRSTLSVKIPENLYEQLTRNLNFKTDFYMGNITLLVTWLSKDPSFTRFGSAIYRPVRLRPDLKLTASEIRSAAGRTEIPVQFRGGLIQYELSNGHKGQINQPTPNCLNCWPLAAGKAFLGVPAAEDATLKIKSVTNACGTGTFAGETRLQLDKSAPYLSINETLVASDVCEGVAFSVPFFSGNLNSTEIIVKTDARTIRKLTGEEIRSGSFQLTLTKENGEYEQRFWLEAGSRSSNKVKVVLVNKPQFTGFNPARKYVSYPEGDTKVYQVQKYSDISPYFYAYHRLDSFEVNGVHYPPDYSYPGFSELSLSTVEQAPVYTLNSVSNACGTIAVNEKFRIIEKSTLLMVSDVTAQSFIPQPYCNGTLKLYEVSYLGIPPVEDHLKFEIALFQGNDSAPLKFFEIPFQKEGNKVRIEIPETLNGNYHFRVKSVITDTYSEVKFFGYFKPRPEVKLVSVTGNSEVTGAPGAILKLESNFEETGEFFLQMNTGEVLSSQDFGIYFTYSNDPDTKELIRTTQNYGRSFIPAQTTTYRVESVFSSCGKGRATGSVKVEVVPYLQLKYNDPSLAGQAFCSGEEAAVSLTYSAGFPKDTLLGLYLHSAVRERDYRELITFKDLQEQISFRLPEDLEQGAYFLQVRKKSRAAVNSALYKRDSLSVIHLDSPVLPLTLITKPFVQLSGSTEIFSGGSADLLLTSLDKAGEHKGYSLDGVTNYISLSSGHSFSLTNTYVSVSPKVTETFSVKSVKNICGAGVGVGEATVVVYPRSGKRVETLGFLRSWPEFNEWYYHTDLGLCAGEKDSLDVNLYGWNSNEVTGSFRVMLSDGKKGSSYLPVTVSRSQEVFFPPSPDGARKLRLWFEIPDTIKEGDSYRIKAVSEDPQIPSVPNVQPGMILERPTASLTGRVLTQTGGQVEAMVKLTGSAPWFFTVTDESDRIIFNNFPTATDSSLREYRYSPYYSDEYLLKLKADSPAEYKVSRVYNWTCGYGKTEGVFTVELILGNEEILPLEVSLYPNPVHDQLRLDLSRLNTDVRVEVFDLLGKLHLTETYKAVRFLGKQTLDLRELLTGTYLVKVTSGGKQQTQRIIKL